MDVTITAVTDSTLRVSIAAVDESLDRYYEDGSVAPRSFARPILTLRMDAEGRNIRGVNTRCGSRPSRCALRSNIHSVAWCRS